jgi:hypothetical protein
LYEFAPSVRKCSAFIWNSVRTLQATRLRAAVERHAAEIDDNFVSIETGSLRPVERSTCLVLASGGSHVQLVFSGGLQPVSILK